MIYLSNQAGQQILEHMEGAPFAEDIRVQLNDAKYSKRILDVVQELAQKIVSKYGRADITDRLLQAVQSPSKLVEIEASLKKAEKQSKGCGGCGRDLLTYELLSAGTGGMVFCAGCSIPESAYCTGCGAVHTGVEINMARYGGGCKIKKAPTVTATAGRATITITPATPPPPAPPLQVAFHDETDRQEQVLFERFLRAEQRLRETTNATRRT